jgi:hypothetical protein
MGGRVVEGGSLENLGGDVSIRRKSFIGNYYRQFVPVGTTPKKPVETLLAGVSDTRVCSNANRPNACGESAKKDRRLKPITT